jgi:hypothetical protein
MPKRPSCYLLPDDPEVGSTLLARVIDDYEHPEAFLPSARLDDVLRDKYDIDLATSYAGLTLRNPWGKASGQLSMTARQVEEDVVEGLGFVVLKTVIAEDESGSRSMDAWAIRESRMLTEPIVGASGERGWTVSWKGRGWWQSFAEYLDLVRSARTLAERSGTLIVPSCKFHLPLSADEPVRESEYRHTMHALLSAWRRDDDSPNAVMPLEKDFSPTLAGSDRAADRDLILRWIKGVPRWLETGATALGSGQGLPALRPGIKLFNALFDDDFQLEMLRAIHAAPSPRFEFFVYGNRLYNPRRQFDGHMGIAFGGPDLSERNLRVLTRFIEERPHARGQEEPLEWSATGNIDSGRMAVEYALRGATSFQLHTFFQLPAAEYRSSIGSRTRRALHELCFHPKRGLIVWLSHIAGRLGLPRNPLRFRDLVGLGLEYRNADPPTRNVSNGVD